MTLLSYSNADGNYADGQPNQGTEVRERFTDLTTFLNGSNLDATNNIKLTSAYPWTARHSWTVSDANNANMALTIGAVMAAATYGFHVVSAAAQINSAMVYTALSNGSSTVACYEASNAGTGSTFKSTTSGDGISYEGSNSASGGTNPVFKATQSGTGPLYQGALRSLTSLNSVMLSKTLTTITTVDNTATETEITDLTVTLPANFLKAGSTIRGRLWGTIDTPGAGVPTGIIKLYYGGTAGTVLLSTGAVTHTTSLAGSLVKVEFNVTCISIGGAGTVEAQGIVTWGSNTVPVNRGMGTGATGAGNTATIAVDTTLSKDLTLSFKWGSAVAGSTFRARSGTIEVLK